MTLNINAQTRTIFQDSESYMLLLTKHLKHPNVKIIISPFISPQTHVPVTFSIPLLNHGAWNHPENVFESSLSLNFPCPVNH